MICNKCKKKIDYDSIFCKYCGEKHDGFGTLELETDAEQVEFLLSYIIAYYGDFVKPDDFDEKIKDAFRKIIRRNGGEILRETYYDVEKFAVEMQKEMIKVEGQVDKKVLLITMADTMENQAKKVFEKKYLPYKNDMWEIVGAIYDFKEYNSDKSNIIRVVKSILGYYYESDEYSDVYDLLFEKAQEYSLEESSLYLKFIKSYARKHKITIIEEKIW